MTVTHPTFRTKEEKQGKSLFSLYFTLSDNSIKNKILYINIILWPIICSLTKSNGSSLPTNKKCVSVLFRALWFQQLPQSSGYWYNYLYILNGNYIQKKEVAKVIRVVLWQKIIVVYSYHQDWISTYTLKNSNRHKNNYHCSLQLIGLLRKRLSFGLCPEPFQPRKPLKNFENTEKSSCMSEPPERCRKCITGWFKKSLRNLTLLIYYINQNAF